MTEERGRTDRRTEERQQRRRRDDTTIDGSQRLHLAIPPEVEARLKAEGRTPRWALDTKNRIHNLTVLDDYDKVEGVDPVPVVIDSKKGTVANQILLSKPTDFIEEDRGKLEKRRKETERAILRGSIPNDPSAGNDSFYADEANSISHGGLGPP